MAEDAKAEDFKAPSTEDVDGLVADMKAKGLSKSDGISMIEKIMGQGAKTSTNLKQERDGEIGARPSDAEATPSPDTTRNPSRLSNLIDSAWGEEESPTPEPVQQPVQKAQVDTSFATDFPEDVSEAGYIGLAPLSVIKTPSSNKELATLVGITLGADKGLIEEELKSGNDTSLNETYAKIQAELDQFMFDSANQEIFDAQNPEAVVTILERLKSEGKTTVNLGTLRTYALSKLETINPERMGFVSRHVARNIVFAQEIQKRSNELSAATPFLSILGDVGEYFLPTGTASEQLSKYKDSIPEALTAIKNSPPEKQISMLNALLDGWEQQETLLIENNNSLMTLGQFQSLRDAILQGGLDTIDGRTDSEIEQYLESALDAGFTLIGAKGVFKSVESVFGYLSKKVFASDNVEVDTRLMAQLFDPNLPSANTLQENQAFYNKVPEYLDRREGLAQAAATKNTTKFRMTLESEKKALGARASTLLNSNTSNTEARELAKVNKIKFKEALKTVKDTKNKELTDIQNRQEVVQSHINDFDSAASAESELSRINQFVKDGRLDPEDLMRPTGKVNVVFGTRTNSHIVDTEYLESPVNKLKIEQEGGLQKIAEATGMTKEDIASRQVFTPTENTDIGFPNMLKNLTTMNELILADKSLTTIGMDRGRDLERQAGTSLTIRDSATGFKFAENDIKDSLGTFTFLLGDGVKGFDNAEDALSASKVGLAGHDVNIVQKDGKWYAETSIEHKFDATRDVDGLYLDQDWTAGTMGRLLLNPLRLLGGDVLKGLFALKGKNRSVVQKLENRFIKSTEKLSAKQGISLSKILERGDNESLDWNTKAAFKSATGETDDKVFDAYRAIRDIYDDVYEIRNKLYYQKLSSKNIKFVDDGKDGNLGSTLNPKSVGKGKDIDSEDGLVWDIETQRLIAPVPDDGFSYVRLTNPIEAGENGLRSIVRVQPEKVSRLPENLLNKRAGHVDRFYRETGWLVKTLGTKTVDGKEVPDNSITHIVSTKAEATKLAEENGGVAVRSRENDEIDSIFGDDESVQFSYSSSHTKKRGETLKGSDGLNAPLLNAFDTMGRSIASTQSGLDFNMLKSVETRFFNEFNDMIARDVNGNVNFSTNARSMIRKTSDSEIPFSEKRLNEFKNWHGYLKTLRSHSNGEVFKAMDNVLAPVFDPIFNVIAKAPLLGLKKRGTDTQAAAMELKGLVSNLFVVLNPLYQVPQNMAIGVYIAGTKGADGIKATLQLPALLVANKTGNYKMLTALVGGDESLARELVDELNNNGLIDAVGRSNDFLDMAKGDLNIGASSKIKSGFNAVRRNTTGLIYNAARGSQEKSLVAMNALSYLAEFNKVTRKGGKFDGRGKGEISFQAQKNVQTQNSLDMFKYQDNNNLLSIPLQFFQHVNKLFLDIIVDPQYKVIVGAVETIIRKEIASGNIGKEAGAYSQTYAQALTTTMLTYATFGMAGGLGSSIGSDVEAKLRKQFPELADVPIFEIMMNGVINETFNSTVEHLGGKGAIDITSTYGPAAFIDMVKSFMLDGFPNFNVMGVSGAATGSIFESLSSIKAISQAPNIDTFEKATMIASEIAEPISGYRNLEKAAIGYLFGQLPYSRSLTSGLKIEKIEAILLAGNIQPALVSDYFQGSSFDKSSSSMISLIGDEKTAQRNAETMIQAMTRDMAYHKITGRLDLAKSYELLEKWSTAAKAVSNPKYEDVISKAFGQMALTSGSATYQEYIKPYEASAQIGNRAEGLKVLRQKAQSPEAIAAFDGAIKIAESTDGMARILEERKGNK